MNGRVSFCNVYLFVPSLIRRILGPLCRQPVSKKRLFSRAAFEPTDEELNIGQDREKHEVDQDIKPILNGQDDEMPDEMPDVASLLGKPLVSEDKGKMKADARPGKSRKKRAKRVVPDSDEEYGDDGDYDDLKDFIVPDDEVDEGERRSSKRPRIRRAASPGDYEESESDISDDDNLILGRKSAVTETKLAPIKAMSKLLPSTKMKVKFNVRQVRCLALSALLL